MKRINVMKKTVIKVTSLLLIFVLTLQALPRIVLASDSDFYNIIDETSIDGIHTLVEIGEETISLDLLPNSDMSDARRKYLALYEGNYSDYELVHRFIALFGWRYPEYILENYSQIFDMPSELIDARILRVLSGFDYMPAAEDVDSGFIPEPMPVRVAPPHILQSHDIGRAESMEERNITDVSARIVSLTHASVTLDLHFRYAGPNNNVSKFNFQTGQWTNLRGEFLHGLPQINTGRHIFHNLTPNSIYVFRTYTWSWSQSVWVDFDVLVRTHPMPTHGVTLTFNSGCNNPDIQRVARVPGTRMGAMPRTPTRNGAVFVGWFETTSPSCTRKFYDNSVVPNVDTTFWAMWATGVILEGNGGTPHTMSFLGTIAGTRINGIPTPPSRPGYAFIGWYNTAAQTGGTRLANTWVMPDSITTFWARWTRHVTVHYHNIVNVNTVAARNNADNSISPEIRQIFLNNFGINLVQRSPASFEPGLNNVPYWTGTSDRIANRALDVNRSTTNTLRFRFVDYRIRNTGGQLLRGQARPLQVITSGNTIIQGHIGDMIVTTHPDNRNIPQTIVHEIAHIFGAPDCWNPGCVMNHTLQIHDAWCDSCRAAILRFLDNQRVVFP